MASAEKFSEETTKEKTEKSKKDRKITLLSLFQGRGRQRKKRPKNSKKD